MDQQMLETEPEPWRSDAEAVQVLSELSRQVFLECPAFVSMWDRISASFDRTISIGCTTGDRLLHRLKREFNRAGDHRHPC